MASVALTLIRRPESRSRIRARRAAPRFRSQFSLSWVYAATISSDVWSTYPATILDMVIVAAVSIWGACVCLASSSSSQSETQVCPSR